MGRYEYSDQELTERLKEHMEETGVKPKVILNGVEVEDETIEENRNMLPALLTLIAALMLVVLSFINPQIDADSKSSTTSSTNAASSSAYQGKAKLTHSSKGTAPVEDYQDGDKHHYVFYPARSAGFRGVKYVSDYEVVILKDDQREDAYVDYSEHKLYVHRDEIVTIRSGEYRRDLVAQEEGGVKYLVAERDGLYDFMTKAAEDGDYGVDDKYDIRTVKEVVYLDDSEGLAYVEGTLEVEYPSDDNSLVQPQAFFTPKTLYVSRDMVRQTNQLHQEYLSTIPTPDPDPSPTPDPVPDPTPEPTPKTTSGNPVSEFAKALGIKEPEMAYA